MTNKELIEVAVGRIVITMAGLGLLWYGINAATAFGVLLLIISRNLGKQTLK